MWLSHPVSETACGISRDIAAAAASLGMPLLDGIGRAEAICEAVTRPTMRFVPVKTTDQQSVQTLHRTRLLFVRHRVRLVNTIRAHLAEYGIVAGVGRRGIEALMKLISAGEDSRVPAEARECLLALAAQLIGAGCQ